MKEYRLSHPSDEHFFPFLFSTGAAKNLKGKVLNGVLDFSGLSMSTFIYEWELY